MNTQADALLKLTALGNLDEKSYIIVMEVTHPSINLPQSLFVIFNGPMEEGWYTPIWYFLTNRELPADKLKVRRIKRLAPMCSIRDNKIYK
jgi:hypothetical protein